jgi:hypothetical protein
MQRQGAGYYWLGFSGMRSLYWASPAYNKFVCTVYSGLQINMAGKSISFIYIVFTFDDNEFLLGR